MPNTTDAVKIKRFSKDFKVKLKDYQGPWKIKFKYFQGQMVTMLFCHWINNNSSNCRNETIHTSSISYLDQDTTDRK